MCSVVSKTWSISCNSDSAGEDTDDPSHPGPSHVTVSDSAGEDTDDQSEIQEEEKCCICRQLTPDEVRNSVSLILTKWVQCSNEDFKHWVHLGYCTSKRVIRRGGFLLHPLRG